MNDFFLDRLNIAHALIDEGNFEKAVELLQNLKTRIHDTEILSKINMHDDDTQKEFKNSEMNISNKRAGPYESFNEYFTLRKWKAQEYLKFYDKIFKEHDI